MSALLLAVAAGSAVPLAWQGTARVYDGDRTIAITVRSRMEATGRVVSESWPTAMGEAKGLRRFILEPTGGGTIERNGKIEAAPAAFVREEVAQFEFYQQLQVAVDQCEAQTQTGPDSNVIVVAWGSVQTAFRCEWNRVTNAANWVAGDGAPVRQDFRIRGLRRSGAAVFPRELRIKRAGRRYFDLEVARFTSP